MVDQKMAASVAVVSDSIISAMFGGVAARYFCAGRRSYCDITEMTH